MSDFIFSSTCGKTSELSRAIQPIYTDRNVTLREFNGPWGSLSVSESTYGGFQPYENERYIALVLGGPVLKFRDNSFVGQKESNAGTRAILRRFIDRQMAWYEDVSGPFVFLVVDKEFNTTTYVTDLMLFIPLYSHTANKGDITFGSHVNAVAKVTGQNCHLDRVSVVDFILHGVVTYPYTQFDDVIQLQPATEYRIRPLNDQFQAKQSKPYWVPVEQNKFTSIKSASEYLRSGVQDYVNSVVVNTDRVAHFISAGEDSRALSGLLPAQVHRDAYIFLDSMNREGRIAQKVAAAYDANFTPGFREPLHYLHVVDDATALIGRGHQYANCHSLGFDKTFMLNQYPAVFGGYLSDSLLKGAYARKSKVRSKYKVLADKWLEGETRSEQVESQEFDAKVMQILSERRRAHIERVKVLRPNTAHEWFVLWPATMRSTIPNHYCNRRLFASHEIFMSHDVVKVSAAVPTEWKLNRKLFHQAFKAQLAKTKWIPHSDLWLPYFSRRTNTPLLMLSLGEVVLRNLNLLTSNEGPWTNWELVQQVPEWRALEEKVVNQLHELQVISGPKLERLTVEQKINLVNLSPSQ